MIMTEFIEIPATKQSLSARKPVYGVGVNDANYIVKPTVGTNKIMTCPYYPVWISILEFCYSEKRHITHPNYIGCSVTKEWLLFSNFRKWMKAQDYQGKQLSKDIIKPGNLHYSPENCCFVSQELNKLLMNNTKTRGKYPQGVHLRKSFGKFSADCRTNGKIEYLGCYPTPEEASQVYLKFKSNLIISIANKQTDIRIKNGLIKHAEILINE